MGAPTSEEVAWQTVLSSKAGRQVLWDILSTTGHTSFLPKEDVERAAGAHNVGAQVIQTIFDIDYHSYVTMLKEAHDGVYDE